MTDRQDKKKPFEQPDMEITGQTLYKFTVGSEQELVGCVVQDQYKILQYIGGGGMGWVYKIHDQAMDEIQAIKILRPEVKEDDIGESLIKKEAKRTQALSHENIIKTFGVIDWNGLLMLRMEYLEGEPLSKLLARETRLPEAGIMPILNQILRALAYTHEKGLIHRDLKPKNIWMLPDGTVKILDFGLSYRITQSLSRTSLKFSSAGSPFYMSPEQLKGEKSQGAEVDIWALGVILYQMATGELPFPGPEFNMFMAQAMTIAPASPSKRGNGISPTLNHIILHCLEKDPENRYAAISTIQNQLKSGVDHKETRAGDIALTANIDCTVYLDGTEQGSTTNCFLSLDDVAYGDHTLKGETTTHRGEAKVTVNGPLNRVELELTQKTGTLYAKSRIGPYKLTIGDETHDCPVILEGLPVGELDAMLTVNGEDYPVPITISSEGTTIFELNQDKLETLQKEQARLTAEAAERAEQERAEREQREAEEKAERERQEAEERRKKLKGTEQEKLDQLLKLPENTVPLLETKRSQLQNLLSGVQFLTETDLQQARGVLARLESAIESGPSTIHHSPSTEPQAPRLTAEAAERAERERAEKAQREEKRQDSTPSPKATKEEQLISDPSTIHHSPSTAPQAPSHRSSIFGWVIGIVVILILGTIIAVSSYQSNQRKQAQQQAQQQALRHEAQLWNSATNTDTISAYHMYLDSTELGRHKDEARTRIDTLEQEKQEEQQRLARQQQEALQRKKAEQAQQEKERKARQAREKDDAAWNIAKQTDTPSSYQAYLSDFGHGRHASQARSAIQKLSRPKISKSGNKVVVTFPGGVSLELVHISSGSFMMGSLPSEKGRDSDEGPRHSVAISHGFYMGKYEVTQKQWQAIMGNNPSDFKGDNRPVENVSWNDCQKFIKKLNQKTGQNFRLPTEAEWEYACRAGTDTAFCYGNSLSSDMANFDGRYPYNASKGTYRGKTTRVGSFKPNAWGLYDMHGNVWEWCQDRWDSDYYKNSPFTDPTGPSSGGSRVLRGGSWSVHARSCRSAYRFRYDPSDRYG